MTGAQPPLPATVRLARLIGLGVLVIAPALAPALAAPDGARAVSEHASGPNAAPAPMRTVNPGAPLYRQLPPEVRALGVLRFVGDSHPPYRILSDEREIRDGIDADLARLLEPVLGVPIRHHVVNGLSATLAGLEAGRYDVAMGPALATRERQLRLDGVSWLITRPSFVYPTSRPARYRRVEDLCGRKISYVAGSVTERVVNRIVDRCAAAGLAASQHVPLADTNMTMVATQAGRADLAGMTLTAALHAAHISEGRFEVYTDETGSLGTDLLSLFVTKRSGLAPVMLAAMQHIVASGEYQHVMAKWGVTAVSVQAPRMNAAQ